MSRKLPEIMPAIADARSIAFDYGGTLVRPTPAPSPSLIAENCMREVNGVLPADFSARLARGMDRAAKIYRARRGDRPLAQVVAEAAGPDAMSAAQIAACLERSWAAQPLERLLPGVAEALGALAGAGFRLVLASNSRRSAKARGEALDRLGIAPMISEIVVSSAIGSAKPEPAFFNAVQQAARGAPIVFVGDSFRRDVIGAVRAGMAAIWVAPTPQPRLRRSIGITDGVYRLPYLLGVAE